MLVSGAKILKAAQDGQYAVPAFNINNLEILEAVMQAAVELRSPVFISTSQGAISYAGMDYLGAMVKVAAKERVPMALHLDHGTDLALLKTVIDSGYYTSVMFDGSALSYADNLAMTKKVVALAHAKKISVEAELGAIGGQEDQIDIKADQARLTDPRQAKDFVKRTHCDSLGVAIGTAHGAFKFLHKPKLDLARLEQIRTAISIPLVLHGASAVPANYVALANKYGGRIKGAKGNSDAEIRQAIIRGICKINIDTDLRMAFTAGIRRSLARDRANIDPRAYLGEGKEYVYHLARHKMKLFGSAGKA
ncbi:MAG: class II fructose-bisphosphate aldolase [Parcubacteria group bacterium]|nr:class II fructose-bisphosphate aldolase [Parcubacteria group bacterium]